MSARIDADAGALAPPSGVDPSAGGFAVAPVADADDRWGTGHALPSDHPKWARDTLSISQRARALVAKLAPVVVRVVSFWEHRVHTLAIGGRKLTVDTSGCYRLD